MTLKDIYFEGHLSLGCHFHVQHLRNYTRYVYRISAILDRLSRRAVSKQ